MVLTECRVETLLHLDSIGRGPACKSWKSRHVTSVVLIIAYIRVNYTYGPVYGFISASYSSHMRRGFLTASNRDS